MGMNTMMKNNKKKIMQTLMIERNKLIKGDNWLITFVFIYVYFVEIKLQIYNNIVQLFYNTQIQNK